MKNITLVLFLFISCFLVRAQDSKVDLISLAQKQLKQYEKEHGNFVQTDNVKMHYLTWGNPKDTPLVWIHGTFSNGYELLDIIPDIVKQDVYVIAIDYYAHGLTPLPNKEVSLYDIADDIHFLMEKLNIEKAIIGGWSRGGTITSVFYDAYPDKVLGLILEDGGSVAWDIPDHKEEMSNYKKEIKEYYSTFQETKTYSSETDALVSALERFKIKNSTDILTHQSQIFTRLTNLHHIDNNKWQFNPGISELVCEDSAEHYLDAVYRTFQAKTLFAISSHLVYPKVIYRNLNVPMVLFDPAWKEEWFPVAAENKALKDAHPDWIDLKIYEDTGHGVKLEHPKRFIADISELFNRVKK